MLWYQMMQTPIDTLWDPTKILEYLPKKAKIQILIKNPDPMFTSDLRPNKNIGILAQES